MANKKTKKALKSSLSLIAAAASVASYAANPFTLAQTPLFVGFGVTPNVLVLLDNSQSMDGTMSGKVIVGDDPSTRGNQVRQALRSILNDYRTAFNWGLASFGLRGWPGFRSTYAYYIGSPQGMVFTNDCVNIGNDGIGVSPSNGNRRCIFNNQTNNYLTFDLSGDDAIINDVLYISSSYQISQLYGRGSYGTRYWVYTNRVSNSTTWDDSDFSGSLGEWGFTPTDAGFLPLVDTDPRVFWLRRGWGYNNDITGRGVINEAVMPDSGNHFLALNDALAVETGNPQSSEIKNAAVFTPLAGSIETARSYFSNTLSGYSTPMTSVCQKNYLVLATDGNPTGKKDGNQYWPSEWQVTFNSDGQTVSSWGQALQDVFTEITALRQTNIPGYGVQDIKTYVIGIGDTVVNKSSIVSLDEFAKRGDNPNSKAYLATDQERLMLAFKDIASKIENDNSSAAASIAVDSGSYTTNADIYQATFSPRNWSGELIASPLQGKNADLKFDNVSGRLVLATKWKASQQLAQQNWDTGRVILTYKPSAELGARGIPFRWPSNTSSPKATELDTAQISALNKNGTGFTDNYGELRLAYLRGSSSQEAANCTAPCGAKFRNRPDGVLGDIVNSGPYYVGPPLYGYNDKMESKAYSQFAANYRTRADMLYVGANDGMLHAFSAETGKEKMAYIPNLVMNSLSKLTSLTYSHRFYVDGTPTVGDAFINSNWRSILVSGLRAGGKGLFALDVTDPSKFNEDQAKNIVLWEYGLGDADMGYVFGQPLIVKTNNGKWSAIIGNGYNSSNGHAVLYIINLTDGLVTAKIDTSSGTTASPNGLSAPAAIDTNGDGIIDYVYAGDLNGNLWKFNLTSAESANWRVAFEGQALFSINNDADVRSITVRPDVTRHPKGGYMVTFGTGQFMASSDINNQDPQALYGIWDKGSSRVYGLSSLIQQKIVGLGSGSDSNSYRITTHAVGAPTDSKITGDETVLATNYYADYRGWYMLLPTAKERVTADPILRGGRAIYVTMIPGPDCDPSKGKSWLMEFDAITGNRLENVVFDVNKDHNLTAADDNVTFNSGKNVPSGQSCDGICTKPRPLDLPQPPGKPGYENKYLNSSTGNIVQIGETSGNNTSQRVMWQQVR